MRGRPKGRRYLRLPGSDPAADIEDEMEFHLAARSGSSWARSAWSC